MEKFLKRFKKQISYNKCNCVFLVNENNLNGRDVPLSWENYYSVENMMTV